MTYSTCHSFCMLLYECWQQWVQFTGLGWALLYDLDNFIWCYMLEIWEFAWCDEGCLNISVVSMFRGCWSQALHNFSIFVIKNSLKLLASDLVSSQCGRGSCCPLCRSLFVIANSALESPLCFLMVSRKNDLWADFIRFAQYLRC